MAEGAQMLLSTANVPVHGTPAQWAIYHLGETQHRPQRSWEQTIAQGQGRVSSPPYSRTAQQQGPQLTVLWFALRISTVQSILLSDQDAVQALQGLERASSAAVWISFQ